jgi:hypothetical protein
MKIEISQKFCPFSHRPGASCLIPFTTWSVRVFPTLLLFSDLEYPIKEKKEFFLPFQGPVKEFTIVQDLENGKIKVFGQAKQGYFRYLIFRNEEGIFIEFEKSPSSLSYLLQNVLIAGQRPSDFPSASEKLSLGMHKILDWELVQRRQDLKEIFPLWLKVAEKIPHRKRQLKYHGTAKLIEECEEKMRKDDKNYLESAFLNLFNAAFYGILTPRLVDDDYQGLVFDSRPEGLDFSPLEILTSSATLIRSLFFKESENELFLLPMLPPSFHCGRFVNIQTSRGEIIHMEWSKKLLRRLIIRTNHQREIFLGLQKPIRSFRIRSHLKDRGKSVDPKKPLMLLPQQVVYLDRFQK